MPLTLHIQDWEASDTANEDRFLTLPSNTPTPVSSSLQRLLQPETHCGIALEPSLAIHLTLHPQHVTSRITLAIAAIEISFERPLSYLAAQQLLHASPVACNQMESYLQACLAAQHLFGATRTTPLKQKPNQKNRNLTDWTADLLSTVSACINDIKAVCSQIYDLTTTWTYLGCTSELCATPHGLVIRQPNTQVFELPRFKPRLLRNKQAPTWSVICQRGLPNSPLVKLFDTSLAPDSAPITTANLLAALVEEHTLAGHQIDLQSSC